MDIFAKMLSAKRLSAADVSKFRDIYQDRVPTELEIMKLIADEYKLPFIEVEKVELSAELLNSFPVRLLLKHELLPIRRQGESILLASGKPFNVSGMDELRALTGEEFKLAVSSGESILAVIRERLGVGAETLDSIKLDGRSADNGKKQGVDLSDGAEDASIIRFVNQVLAEAVKERTTDVHIEPYDEGLRVRYRVDGVLRDVPTPDSLKRFQSAVISRVKIMSGLDIAEKRLPQDGRIKLHTEVGDVDVRVSIIPMVHGEAVVMRLLRQNNALLGVNELNMSDLDRENFRSLLSMPHGIVLVTGPTGSGKTTTLYAALQEINDSERKIITIEDPVEYQIKGLNQIQVSEKTGLTFARGLRSILRHDPDVILVGEIRDRETAEIAVQASLTGHLVFSTLHTNDSPGALTRLVDMGIEPYLVASSVEAVLAQRLVRKLCPECRGEGCDACHKTGYYGRQAIFELLSMDETTRRMVLDSASAGEIREHAEKNGWRSLSQDGERLIKQGITNKQEVMRVTKDSSGKL